MSFLKKIGSILLKATQIVVGFQPIATGAFPAQAGLISTTVSELQQLADIVITIEAAGQAVSAPGADKLKMAVPLFAQAFLQSSAFAHLKIEKPDLFQAAVTGIASNYADLLNSFKGDVETTDKAA